MEKKTEFTCSNCKHKTIKNNDDFDSCISGHGGVLGFTNCPKCNKTLKFIFCKNKNKEWYEIY